MIVCPICGAGGLEDNPVVCDWDHDGVMMIRINPNCEKCKGTGKITIENYDGKGGKIIFTCKKCVPENKNAK